MDSIPPQLTTMASDSTIDTLKSSSATTSPSSNELPSCLNMTSLELRTHLETLPQELFDEIVKLVFTPVSGTTVKLSKKCRNLMKSDQQPQLNLFRVSWNTRIRVKSDPQPQLNIFQVSSNTRKKVAAAYYSKNVFVADYVATLDSWLETLSASHRPFLSEVQCSRPFISHNALLRYEDPQRERLLKHGLKGTKFIRYVVATGELGFCMVV